MLLRPKTIVPQPPSSFCRYCNTIWNLCNFFTFCSRNAYNIPIWVRIYERMSHLMVVYVAQYLTSMFRWYDDTNGPSNMQSKYLQDKKKLENKLVGKIYCKFQKRKLSCSDQWHMRVSRRWNTGSLHNWECEVENAYKYWHDEQNSTVITGPVPVVCLQSRILIQSSPQWS